MLRYKAYGVNANSVPAAKALALDAPSARMHQVAARPLSTTSNTQVTLIAANASGTTRLTSQTSTWSTVLLDGYETPSSPCGAPSRGFHHHQPLSIVLLDWARYHRLSLTNPSGTRISRCQPSSTTHNTLTISADCTSGSGNVSVRRVERPRDTEVPAASTVVERSLAGTVTPSPTDWNGREAASIQPRSTPSARP